MCISSRLIRRQGARQFRSDIDPRPALFIYPVLGIPVLNIHGRFTAFRSGAALTKG
jgi:hypothetical protein